jgi:serine/threonine protein kinase
VNEGVNGRNGWVRKGESRIPRLSPAPAGVWHATMSESAPAEDRLVAGRYRLTRVVGRGGMGVLWAAEDRTLGREVAVKEVRLPADLPPDQSSSLRQRALREARAAARVTHPSAVTVYDVVEEDGRPWIVMELLSPRTLADVLAEDGPLTPAAAARLGLDLLDALATAHAAGVVHRDVKPANLLFADGRPVLVDFGIATLDDDPTITATGMLLGSPAFMAPERARGEQPTPASDLWSLGATLFAAVEGEPPFRRDGHLPTLAALVTQDPPPARHAGRLRSVIAALLAREPADRPTAERARALLHAVMAGVPLATVVRAPATSALTGPIHAASIHAAVADTVASPLATTAAALLRLPSGRTRRRRALVVAMLAPVAIFALAAGLPMPWQHTSTQGTAVTSSNRSAGVSTGAPATTVNHRTPATRARSRVPASRSTPPATSRQAPRSPTAVASWSSPSAGKAEKKATVDGHGKGHQKGKGDGHGGGTD